MSSDSFNRIGLNDRSLADILITDPPYCLLTRRRRKGDLRDPKHNSKLDYSNTVTRFENVTEYKEFTNIWLTNCISRALKPEANMVIWTNSLGKNPIIDCCKKFGYGVVGEYVWAKESTPVKSQFYTKNETLLRVYETAVIFSKDPSQYRGDYSKYPWSVISGYHGSDQEQDLMPYKHPNHKPFQALEPLLVTWSKPSDIILDPFAGSGGILLAALKLNKMRNENRVVKGLEILPEWVDYVNQEIKRIGGSD